MANETLKDILESTRSLIAVKQAEFNSNLEGGEKAAKGLDMSGAGDDSPKTRGHGLGSEEAALNPQKKPLDSADANANPPSDGNGTTGKAEGRDESNVTDRTGTLGSEDSAPGSVAKKPLVSGDANAKTAADEDGAAKLANDILGDILKYRETQKQASDKPKEGEGEKQAADKSEEGEGEKQAANKSEEGEGEKSKQAHQGPHMELTTDVLAKVAALILSSEEGADFVEAELAKAAGAEAAQETLRFLAEQSELAEKTAAYDAGAADAESLIQQAVNALGAQGSQKQAGNDATQLVREVANHLRTTKQASQADQLSFYEKLGQDAADASIGELMGAADDPMSMGAEELGGDMAGAEVMPDEAGMDEGITEEELAAALESLIQDGSIGPDEAAQIIEFITQAEGGGEDLGAAVGGEDLGAAVGGEAAAAPADEGMEATASDMTSELLSAIRKARGQNA